jgi:hypothetical protein
MHPPDMKVGPYYFSTIAESIRNKLVPNIRDKFVLCIGSGRNHSGRLLLGWRGRDRRSVTAGQIMMDSLAM